MKGSNRSIGPVEKGVESRFRSVMARPGQDAPWSAVVPLTNAPPIGGRCALALALAIALGLTVPAAARAGPGSPAARTGPGRTPPPRGTSSTGVASPHRLGDPVHELFDPSRPGRMVLAPGGGRVIMASGSRILELDPGARTDPVPRTLARNLAGEVVDLAVDREGRIWGATTRNVVRIDPEGGGAAVVLDRGANRVLALPGGRALAGSIQGLDLIDGDSGPRPLGGREGALGPVLDLMELDEASVLVLESVAPGYRIHRFAIGPAVRITATLLLEPPGRQLLGSVGPLGLSPTGSLLCGSLELGPLPGSDLPVPEVRPLPLRSPLLFSGGLSSRWVRRHVRAPDATWVLAGAAAPGVVRWSDTGFAVWRTPGIVHDMVLLPDGEVLLSTGTGLVRGRFGGDVTPVISASGPGNAIHALAPRTTEGPGVYVAAARGLFEIDPGGRLVVRAGQESHDVDRTSLGPYGLVGGAIHRLSPFRAVPGRAAGPFHVLTGGRNLFLIAARDRSVVLVSPVTGEERPVAELPARATDVLAAGEHVHVTVAPPFEGLWISRLVPAKSRGPTSLSALQRWNVEYLDFERTAPIIGAVVDGRRLILATRGGIHAVTGTNFELLAGMPAADPSGIGLWNGRILLFSGEGRVHVLDGAGAGRGVLEAPFLAGVTITGFHGFAAGAWIGTRRDGLIGLRLPAGGLP